MEYSENGFILKYGNFCTGDCVYTLSLIPAAQAEEKHNWQACHAKALTRGEEHGYGEN